MRRAGLLFAAAVVFAQPAIAQDDGWTIDSAQLLLVPYGRDTRDVESAALSAQRVQRDPFGLRILGASSPETNLFIDGLRVDSPAFGLPGTSLLVDFLDRIEVAGGPARARDPRGTGGAVEAFLKSGTDEFHGSVFGYWSPYEASRRSAPAFGSLSATSRLAYDLDAGAELSGPILRKRLWFYAALAPQVASQNVDRIISAQTSTASGNPVLDPDGNPVVHEVARTTYSRTATSLLFAGKMTWLVADGHLLSASVFGDPGRSTGANGALVGNEGTFLFDRTMGSANGVLRYRGSFGATTVDAFLGAHHEWAGIDPADLQGAPASTLADTPQVVTAGVRNLLDPLFLDDPTVPAVQKSQAVSSGCAIQQNGFNPCPVSAYAFGGAGALDRATADRLVFGARATHAIELLGRHRFSYGVDAARDVLDVTRTFSGGAAADLRTVGTLSVVSYGHADPAKPGSAAFDPAAAGDIRLADNIARSSTRTVTLSAFVEDSWTLFGRLRLDAGLRLWRQLLYADGSIVSASGVPAGSQIDVSALLPRLGLSYDILGSGSLRAFASYSRTAERMPLDLVDRGLGPPAVVQLIADPNNCRVPSDLRTCAIIPNAFGAGRTFQFFGGTLAESVSPDLSPPLADQFDGGLEASLAAGMRARLSYVHAQLARAVEDFTPDDGATFVVANQDGARNTTTGNGAAVFLPEARRVYDAFTAALSRRFRGQWLLSASYTLASLSGNYSGLFAANTGELRPHYSSDFDLPSVMVNRDGPLPGDIRHAFRVDGAFAQPLGSRSRVTLGAALRADSGSPLDSLGADARLGPNEIFVLPRGSAGRLPWTWQLDLRAGAETMLAGYRAGVSLDVLNATNNREVIAVDQTYTFDRLASGVATPADLPNLRNVAGQNVALNTNFLRPTAYQLPLQLRLGARVSF